MPKAATPFANFVASMVRTVVPLVVGWVISLALRHGFDLHDYATQITLVVTAVYYAAARAAEHYLAPQWGWLLGIATQPKYGKPVAH